MVRTKKLFNFILYKLQWIHLLPWRVFHWVKKYSVMIILLLSTAALWHFSIWSLTAYLSLTNKHKSQNGTIHIYASLLCRDIFKNVFFSFTCIKIVPDVPSSFQHWLQPKKFSTFLPQRLYSWSWNGRETKWLA